MDSPEIPILDRVGLRRFGLTTGVIVWVLFGIGLPWLFGLTFPLWPWIIGGMLICWGLVAPQTMKLLYHGWMRFGLLLNRVTNPLIMGVVFFVVISPVALVMIVLGRDSMSRRLNNHGKSYRVEKVKRPPAHMEKPF